MRQTALFAGQHFQILPHSQHGSTRPHIDNGISIPPEDVPFGFGLGLAIVQAIVVGCNGRIAIHPQTPGTQVQIHLMLLDLSC